MKLYLENIGCGGTIPRRLTNNKSLKIFSLAGNNYIGNLPHSFHNLSFLNTFNLRNNLGMSGDISSFLCDRITKGTLTIDISKTNLTPCN